MSDRSRPFLAVFIVSKPGQLDVVVLGNLHGSGPEASMTPVVHRSANSSAMAASSPGVEAWRRRITSRPPTHRTEWKLRPNVSSSSTAASTLSVTRNRARSSALM